MSKMMDRLKKAAGEKNEAAENPAEQPQDLGVNEMKRQILEKLKEKKQLAPSSTEKSEPQANAVEAANIIKRLRAARAAAREEEVPPADIKDGDVNAGVNIAALKRELENFKSRFENERSKNEALISALNDAEKERDKLRMESAGKDGVIKELR